MKVQVFIMGAGKGSRIKYNLGKKMPKCLLPSILVAPVMFESTLHDTILYRIVKSFRIAEVIGNHEIKIDLFISHKSKEVANYINTEFPDLNLHQIDWSPSSTSTFKKCVEVAKNQEVFDKYIFINGDTYIDNIESLQFTLNDLIECPDGRCAVTEKFRDPQNVWSSIQTTGNNYIFDIYPDYTNTCETLCDITQFDYESLMEISEIVSNPEFKDLFEWWEMSFINDVNKNNKLLKSIPVRKIRYVRVLYNTNNLGLGACDSYYVQELLKKFHLNFKEEESFDVEKES